MKSISILTLALTSVLLGACKQHEEHATPSATASTATTSTTHTHTESSPEPGATLTPAPPPAGVEPVAGPKLTPIDQGPTDPTFVAYRDRLRAAVKSRDAKAVAALADPKMRTSFGDGGVNGDLAKILARPGMWEELDTVLSHGGSFLGEGESRSFWAPYVYSAWPEERDAFSHFAVIDENVPLRRTADANGETIATMSYDIVARASSPATNEGAWRQVKTADGRTGFVESKFVLSPIGYRAGFMKEKGEWKMNAFVAGD